MSADPLDFFINIFIEIIFNRLSESVHHASSNGSNKKSDCVYVDHKIFDVSFTLIHNGNYQIESVGVNTDFVTWTILQSRKWYTKITNYQTDYEIMKISFHKCMCISSTDKAVFKNRPIRKIFFVSRLFF